jgi:hypothetical protein
MITRRTLSIAGVFGAAAMLVATQASAHAHLVSSSPAADATVPAPKAITLTFNEKLVPTFSGFEVSMVDHNMKAPVKTTISKDGKSITGTPGAALMKGSYKISWHAASADGHRMNGEVAFKVG